MQCYFFNILEEWHKFMPYLYSNEFIESLNIYHWWNFQEENGNIEPLIRSNNKLSNDEKYIIDKLKNCNNNDIYYYCVPHDCIELNNIVMGTLLSLYINKDKTKIYHLSIAPEDYIYDKHIVICNKYLSTGDKITLVHNNDKLSLISYDNVDNSNIILFDLIYPLMPYFGKRSSASPTGIFDFGNSWSDNTQKLENLIVLDCTTLQQQWDDMGYINYYNKK